MKRYLLVAVLLSIKTLCFSAVFPGEPRYEVCFSPSENCTDKVVEVIDRPQQDVYMQAYSFTSQPIAEALVRAKKRGIKVQVILDNSQFIPNHCPFVLFLLRNGIVVWDDFRPHIAHNKVMIIDQSIVETGSFNYTVSAQKYNAENTLIIYSKSLAQRYLCNWYSRQHLSRLMKSCKTVKKEQGVKRKKHAGGYHRHHYHPHH